MHFPLSRPLMRELVCDRSQFCLLIRMEHGDVAIGLLRMLSHRTMPPIVSEPVCVQAELGELSHHRVIQTRLSI